jgi:hypothetical protein
MQEGEPCDVRIRIWPPSDLPPVTFAAHRKCFEAVREASVGADSPEEYGRIPAKARCAFCGQALPFVGKHPMAMEIGEDADLQRYWAHADCIANEIAGNLPIESNGT